MKKVLVVASLAIISTPSFAKTKVFGELHASYDNVFAVGEKSRDGFKLNNSFVGFKGSTEIKKDVSLIYQFVWGVNQNGFDTLEYTGFENKNQVIGLASPSGALIIGRFDTPFKTVGKKADLFWHSQLGQNRNITNAQTWDLRADKLIAIQSPKINGFQGSIAYASDISDTSRVTANASAISLNVFYKKGNLVFGSAYETHDLEDSSANQQAIRFFSSYRRGPVKLVGFLQKEDNDTQVTAEPDALVFGVGASYRKGKGTFKAQFYNRDIDGSGRDSNLFAVGYDYSISKNLDVYIQAAKMTNADNLGRTEFSHSNFNISDDVHGISIGIRYKF